ncbi:MAG: hypothetical protein IJ598_07530 [Ruminococcus sp.]|nr:hypothetical protein [Ruminococcus sp.]
MNAICQAAVGFQPVTANESNATVWIFAIVIGVLAVGGVAYFLFNNKKK